MFLERVNASIPVPFISLVKAYYFTAPAPLAEPAPSYTKHREFQDHLTWFTEHGAGLEGKTKPNVYKCMGKKAA